MAKTISQTAGREVTTQPMQTSQEISSLQKLDTPEIKAGDSIAKDMASIIGMTGKVSQEVDRLRVKSAKRAATDSLSILSKKMSAIDEKETPDNKDEIADLHEMAYQETGRKVFDDEDSQLAFDSIYHAQGSQAVASRVSTLRVEANKYKASELKKHNLALAQDMIVKGMWNTDIAQSLKDSTTSGGWNDGDAWDLEIATLRIKEFETITKTADFTENEAGKFNKEAFNSYYSSYFDDIVNIDKKGNRVYNTDNVAIKNAMEDQYTTSLHAAEVQANKVRTEYYNNAVTLAKATIHKGSEFTDENGVTHYYAANAKIFEDRINKEFPLLKEDKLAYAKVMNIYKDDSSGSGTAYPDERLHEQNKQGGATNKKTFIASADEQIATFQNLRKRYNKSSSGYRKYSKAIQNLEDDKYRYNYISTKVNEALTTSDFTEVENYITNGTTTPDGVFIGTSFTKNAIAQTINNIDKNLSSIDLSSNEGKTKFANGLKFSYNLSNAGSIKSKFLIGIGKKFNSDYESNVETVNEARGMLMAAQLVAEDSNNAYGIILAEDQIAELSRIVDDTTMSDESKVAAFNKTKYSYKAKRNAIINGSKQNTIKLLKYYNSKGGDTRAEITMLNWAMRNDTTVKDKSILTETQAYDIMVANSVIYRKRESDTAGPDFIKDTARTLASFVSDRYDAIVVPNRIGNYTDKNKMITNGITGLLKYNGLDMDDVYVKVSSEGNVAFFRRDTNARVAELNGRTIETFAKFGSGQLKREEIK